MGPMFKMPVAESFCLNCKIIHFTVSFIIQMAFFFVKNKAVDRQIDRERETESKRQIFM